MRENILLDIMKYIYKFANTQKVSVTIQNYKLLSFHWELKILRAKKSN